MKNGFARVVLAGAVLWACGASGLPPGVPHAMVGSVPAAETVSTLDGKLAKIPRVGAITVIDFWSTSCENCRPLYQVLNGLQHDYGAKGVAVLGIAADDNPGLVLAAAKTEGLTYPSTLDDAGALRGRYRVDSLPQTFVFDRKGKLRVAFKGGKDGDQIRRAVETLLAEGGDP